MNAEVPPGERLNIEELARRLDVSPTPVREALARLESEELTVKLPLRGYTTTELLDAQQVRDLYDFRLLLEVPSAGLAASRMTDEWADTLIAEMSSIHAAPAEAVYESYREYFDHDARLHELILDCAGNEAVTHAFLRAHSHLHMYRLAYDGRHGQAGMEEHARLVGCLVRRDALGARAAMREHLTRTRDRALAEIEPVGSVRRVASGA